MMDDNIIENIKNSDKYIALSRSSFSFFALIKKLEQDSYLKSNNSENINFCDKKNLAELIMTELLSFVVSINIKFCNENNIDISTLEECNNLLFENLKSVVINSYIQDFVCKISESIDSDVYNNILEGYSIINRFDNMAASFDKAFYNNLGVEYPGKLIDYYIQLIEGYIKFIAQIINIPSFEEFGRDIFDRIRENN